MKRISKKILMVALSLILTFAISCGSNENPGDNPAEVKELYPIMQVNGRVRLALIIW